VRDIYPGGSALQMAMGYMNDVNMKFMIKSETPQDYDRTG
jgi:hypothetical protein